MLKKILFKQIALNNEQLFGLSEYGDVFEYVYDKNNKKSFWLKLPSEYEDSTETTNLTATVSPDKEKIDLGRKMTSFWENYEHEQQRKLKK